jgi:hypothetical protein
MEPDVGLTVEQDRAGGRPRPSLLVRAMEIAGLVLVILGLGDGRLWLAVLGAALVVGSYAIFRRKHGAGRASGGGSDSPDSDDGGGGD